MFISKELKLKHTFNNKMSYKYWCKYKRNMRKNILKITKEKKFCGDFYEILEGN